MIFRIISVTYFSPRKYRFESIKFPTVLSVGTILHVRRPPTSRRTQTFVVQEERERDCLRDVCTLWSYVETCDQCDQIGLLLKRLGDIFSYKMSPNIVSSLCAILKSLF